MKNKIECGRPENDGGDEKRKTKHCAENERDFVHAKLAMHVTS